MIARLEVLPGAGTVARYGEVTVWAGAGASSDLLTFLVQSARNLASLPDGGRRIADHLAGVLRQRDPEPAIPFVTVGPGEYTPVTLLHGPVQMWDGARWVRPDPAIGWLVSEVSNLTTVLVTPNDTPAPPSANPILDLRTGVVPGGGLAVVLTPPSVMPTDDPVGSGPAELESRTAEDPASREDPTQALTPGAGGPGPESAGPESAGPEEAVPQRSEPEMPEPGTSETSQTSEPGLSGVRAAEAGLGGATLVAGALAEGLPARESATAPTGAPDDTGRPPGDTARDAGSDEPHPDREPEDAQSTLTEAPAPAGPGEGADSPGGTPAEPAEPVGLVNLRTAPTDSWTPLPPAEAGAPSPPASPIVRGLRCPRGHFNHTGVATCATCGLPLDPVLSEGEGPRPVLGVLVGTDGSLWRVDADYLVGTDPASDSAVSSGAVRALVVADDGQAQPVHAELRASGWTLSVVDRSSRSGTFVLPPGHSDWQKIPPDQPIALKPGTHVAVGTTVFTFTSPWPL